jgi:membrane-bound lytic murein transglycosylase MltF
VWLVPVLLLLFHFIHHEEPPALQFVYTYDCETPVAAPIVEDRMVDHVRQMFHIKRSLAEEITVAARAAGELHEIDPWLIIAFIKVESDGRTEVISPAGAVGLMQLLPSTGQEIASKLGEEWRGKEQLFEVGTNIRYGTYYLRQLVNRFGTMQAAIAAYNWGPNHIARRIKRNAELPTEYPIKVLAALYTPPSE